MKESLNHIIFTLTLGGFLLSLGTLRTYPFAWVIYVLSRWKTYYGWMKVSPILKLGNSHGVLG
jgi:hypothetical protein